MPGCCVKNCNNRTEKGYRLFSVPVGDRNTERRKKWLEFINRPEMTPRACICEVHFNEDQFERQRADGRKLLKGNAVPTLTMNEILRDVTAENKAKAPDKIFPHKHKRSESEDANTSKTNDQEVVPTLNRGFTFSNAVAESMVEGLDNSPPQKQKRGEYARENNSELNIAKSIQLPNVQRQLQWLQEKNQRLEAANKQLREKYSLIFNEDQITHLERGSHRGAEWSDATVSKGLRLYMACGAKGYEELQRQHIPLPSIRTLQHRIRVMKFDAGVLEDIFNLLELKVMSFQPQEKEAGVLLDEMAIQPGLQYDNSLKRVVGRPTMKLSGNEDSSKKLATHALVFMLAGMCSRWKQTIQYEFTAESYSADEVLEKLWYLVRRADSIGITIRTIISDMGPQNRAFWRLLSIGAHRHGQIKNSIAHPVNSSEKLYVMPDPVHIFKNIALSLLKHKRFVIDPATVTKFHLVSNVINIEVIERVFAMDCDQDFKVAPKLKQHMFDPTHFAKMNVNTAFAIFNHDTAAAITYYISQGKLQKDCATTAWFCALLFKWFTLMTARHQTLGLSKNHMNTYQETIQFLQDFIDIVCNININDSWAPWQCGLLLATKTALDLQEEYIRKQNFQYVLLGRLTQDAIENLFSVVRSRTPVPDAREFKTSLRLITLSQYEAQKLRGNYFMDNRSHLIQYCKSIETQAQLLNSEESSVAHFLPLVQDLTDAEQITSHDEQCIYYLLGSILASVKDKTCNNCFSPLVNTKNDAESNNNEVQLLTKLKCYKENILTFPTLDLYYYIRKAELYFRSKKTALLSNALHFDSVAQDFLKAYTYVAHDCHAIMHKIIRLYMRTRFFFALRQYNTTNSNAIRSNIRSSKSVAMRFLANNMK